MSLISGAGKLRTDRRLCGAAYACAVALLSLVFAATTLCGQDQTPLPQDGSGQENGDPISDPKPGTKPLGRRPLVVLKQTAIHGRVILIKEQEDQSFADDLHIEVRDTKDDHIYSQTKTNKDGTFSLPSLEVGSYQLKAGRLIVELKVEDPIEEKGRTNLPKTILIIMPEALTD